MYKELGGKWCDQGRINRDRIVGEEVIVSRGPFVDFVGHGKNAGGFEKRSNVI